MITELRNQLLADLRTGSGGTAPSLGVTVYDLWPGRVAAPCAVIGIEPGTYISGGQTFCEYQISFTVTLLVQRSANDIEELEDLIEKTLMNTADWGLTGIDSPGIVNETGMELIGTVVHLRKNSKL